MAEKPEYHRGLVSKVESDAATIFRDQFITFVALMHLLL